MRFIATSGRSNFANFGHLRPYFFSDMVCRFQFIPYFRIMSDNESEVGSIVSAVSSASRASKSTSSKAKSAKAKQVPKKATTATSAASKTSSTSRGRAKTYSAEEG